MALNVGLDESFRRLQDETREVNTTQALVTKDKAFCVESLVDVIITFCKIVSVWVCRSYLAWSFQREETLK
jgi:hypothetical protein